MVIRLFKNAAAREGIPYFFVFLTCDRSHSYCLLRIEKKRETLVQFSLRMTLNLDFARNIVKTTLLAYLVHLGLPEGVTLVIDVLGEDHGFDGFVLTVDQEVVDKELIGDLGLGIILKIFWFDNGYGAVGLPGSADLGSLRGAESRSGSGTRSGWREFFIITRSTLNGVIRSTLSIRESECVWKSLFSLPSTTSWDFDCTEVGSNQA